MLRAIIIDDEPAHRMGIKRHVHWKDLGYEEPLLAQGGEEAIKIIEQNNISVVITDICMPGMSGIEMLHNLKSSHKDLNIIIISGFDEFEFARQSIEEGARTYLLKPLKIEELEKWLVTFREEITLKENIENEDKAVKDSLKFSLDIARGKFSELLLTSYNIEKQYILNMAKALKLPESKFYCTIATIVIPNYFDAVSKNFEDGIALAERIKKAIDVTLGGIKLLMFTSLKPNRMVALICDTDANDGQSYANQLEVMCSTLSSDIGIDIAIVMDNAYTSWEGIHKLYRKSVSYLNYMGKIETGNVLWVLKDEQYEKNFKPMYYADELSKAIAIEDVNSIAVLSESMFVSSNDIPFENLKAMVMSIVGDLVQAMSKVNKINNNISMDLWKDLLLADDCTKLNKIFSDMINEFVSGIVEKQKGTKHFIIERAVKYINENYHNDIAVQNLAAFLNINQSYLSVLFKKEMGTTISNYLSEIRIEKAKEYLNNLNVKIYDITTLVGYQTPAYFTYQFKKHVGCTPTEFRERNL